MGNGQCRRFRQWPARTRRRDSSRDPLCSTACTIPATVTGTCVPSQIAPACRILAGRHALPIPPADQIANGRLPRGASVLGGIPQKRPGPLPTGRGEDRETPAADGGATTVVLAPIPPRDPFALHSRASGDSRARKNAPSKNDTRRSRCHTSRRHIGPDPTSRPRAGRVSLGRSAPSAKARTRTRLLPNRPPRCPATISPVTPAAIARRISALERRFPQDQPARLVNRSYCRLRNRGPSPETLRGTHTTLRRDTRVGEPGSLKNVPSPRREYQKVLRVSPEDLSESRGHSAGWF